MRKWNDWQSHGAASAFQVVEGYRPMSVHNGNFNTGLRLYTQTPRYYTNNADPSDWTWAGSNTAVQGGLGEGTNTSPDGTPQIIFCAHDSLSIGNPTNMINFFPGTMLDVEWLLSLPYFTTLGNTPDSTTDWNTIVLQLYRVGGWFWTEGGWPPIKGPGTESVDLRPACNYEFHMDECYDGTTLTSYVDSHNQSANTIFGTAPSSTAAFTSFPWDATFNFNDVVAFENSSNLSISEVVTHEYVGSCESSGNQYLLDARGGAGGTWFLMNYQGHSWNWSNNLQFSGQSNSDRHHALATGNSSTNSSKLYYGSGNGWEGEVASGTCSTAMTTINTGLHVGERHTQSTRWDGMMSMFRTWAFEFDDDMAEISWLHNQARIPVFI